MITPTIGRVVWYYPGEDEPGGFFPNPFPAFITNVWSDVLINVMIFPDGGLPYWKADVLLLQDKATTNQRPYCEWMPFQKTAAIGPVKNAG